MAAMERYAEFDQLRFERPAPHVLRITLATGAPGNAANPALHDQLVRLWRTVDGDPLVRAAIITGADRAFCVGGSADAAAPRAADPLLAFDALFSEARALVDSMLAMRKPLVSAINGPAVGVGLAVALLADIPIASESAKLIDGHLNIGVVPGDHAALIWPLLCGLAKSKYYLLTNSPLTGAEAERCNLVALAVPADELQARALAVATRLAEAAPLALRMTKHVLNHHIRRNAAIFELSAALEMIGLQGGESREAIRAMLSGDAPRFADTAD